MTERGLLGKHRHRMIRTRPGSRLQRVLTHQFFHSTNMRLVMDSPFVWGPCHDKAVLAEKPCYGLSLLGVLHTVFGLTLAVVADDAGSVQHG